VLTNQAQDVQEFYENIMNKIQSWPMRLKVDLSWLYIQIAQPIVDVDEGKRVAGGFAVLCVATWLMWKSPRLQPFMRKYFTHDPLSGRSITLLTSMFR
jgi:rhomboid-like protein